jgi:putative transcriptional regulator
MTKRKRILTYSSKISAAVHETMQDAHDIGLIDKKTMRNFDASCLTEVDAMTAKDVAALREREGVSQAVLAHHLNVAVKLVGEWERGEKRPSGPSLKLLSLVKAKGLDAIA